ncbi:MAG: AAA family ATPase [Desulfobacteraceae bacterium]|nr:AAA family ATPase [Desulfobacteraceae bacterium]
MEPTIEQLSAVEMVRKHGVSLLVGGPGTGKTFTTKLIIDWAKSNNLTVTQAAPTGKAAKRMMEATGEYSSTIHSMLGCRVNEKGEFEFTYRAGNTIPTNLLILDEVSMITNNLMARVLDAVDTKRTKVLLIGDENQLPSVGAGAILRDILAAKVIPYTKLTIIHRFLGTIVQVCDSIKKGESYFPSAALAMDRPDPINLIHIECSTPEQTLAGIKKVMCERMPLRGYDPVEDVQVISPVNTKGMLSCEYINSIIKESLNPMDGLSPKDKEDVIAAGSNFRPGDKVINTKNGIVQKTDGRQSAIVNGDIGQVVSVSKKRMVVLFPDPEREVYLPKNDKNLLHAYCITCHKFQGSEAPVVIIPVHAQFNYFLSNSWLYTAISRGKEIVITIGSFQTIEKAIQNRIPNNRVTRLKERLIEAYRAIIEEEFEDI